MNSLLKIKNKINRKKIQKDFKNEQNSRLKNSINNQNGQALIEYLILVALMAIATIGVVRSVNHVVNSKFIEIDYALRGVHKNIKEDPVNEALAKKRDFSNFLNGVASHEKK